MMRTPTSRFLLTLLKVAIYLDMMGVRKGDQYHLMQPIYLYWNI
ncbi:MAG: hypothetical protein ACK51L_01525 [bacterium]